MRPQPGYYRHPTIHGDRIVFVCEDDLFTVDASGGVARRLTANPGRATFPLFSPDGSTIAFTGQDEGPTEIFVMDADGGAPRRLTWLGAITQTSAWRPDGKRVIFTSTWRQMFRGPSTLGEIDSGGGAPSTIPWGPARAIAFEPGGQGVVLGRNSADPARWKRYRGGTAGTIWIDRKGTGDFAPLLALDGNLANPMWIGTRIYFLSDHEGHGNLYSCTPTGRGLKRHTHHDEFYVRFPSTDGKRIVYQAGGDLFLLDLATADVQKIDVRILSSRPERARRFVDGGRFVETFALHPEGHSAAVVSRGGVYALPLWDGAVVRHGSPSRERRRLAAWLEDGKRIVSVSDVKGEEALLVESAGGDAAPRQVVSDIGRVVDLAVAPTGGAKVALANHRHELLIVDVTKRQKKVIDRSEWILGILGLAWSPDGRYLAYALATAPRSSSLRIHDTQTGRTHVVTDSAFVDAAPAFDPEGKYLYFVSWRVFDPVYDSQVFDLGFPRGSRPYLVTLKKDLPSPFDAAQREPRPPLGADAESVAQEAMAKAGKKKGPPKVAIDFAGIESRVVAFPVPEGRYERILGAPGRALFTSLPIEGALHVDWLGGGEPPAIAKLEAYDYETEKVETLFPGVTDFSVAAKSPVLAVRIGNRFRVVQASAKSAELQGKDAKGRASGWVDLSRLRVEVLPGEEWRQMFREAWRLQRDHFWTPDMAGIAWQGVHDRYLPLVDRVSTRSEFSDLVWEMQGELGTSHCYEMGGDYRLVPPWHQGFLGADLELSPRKGTWRIARIPQGDPWNARYASPLSAPGLGIVAGEEILAVDGQKVGRDRTPYECLVYRAGQPVRLRIRGRNGKLRTVSVQTVASEELLRYRDWVESNRAAVHKQSRGKVGYVHIPDMGAFGYSEFFRYYRNEVDSDGLIVDVRFNGGGHVSQILLEKLARKRIGYDKSRWQKELASYPEEAPMGPMVALTNEYAGSDGDIFSHSFKLLGLGKLIGTRTWGGVVGIWPRHALVDGTWTTQPEFSNWFSDVGWSVENYGTDPDIEVVMRPQDYAAGRDPQLERGLQEVQALIKREKPSVPKLTKRPNLKPPKLPPA